jgi:nucleolar protein 4
LSKEEVARSNVASKEADHDRKLKGKGITKQVKFIIQITEGGKVEKFLESLVRKG